MTKAIILAARRAGAILVATGLLALPALAVAGSSSTNFWLISAGNDPDARALVKFQDVPGSEKMVVTAKDLAPGAYTVEANGLVVGSLDMTVSSGSGGGTVGSIRFAAADGTFNFNPDGALLSISQAGTPYFWGTVPASRLEATTLVRVKEPLLATGVDTDAIGTAEYRMRRGRSRFYVKVRNLPTGTYDLTVSGFVQGFIDVDSRGRGRVRFNTLPMGPGGYDQPDLMLLSFDPLGQKISVNQAGLTYLTVDFPPDLGSGGANPPTVDPTPPGGASGGSGSLH